MQVHEDIFNILNHQANANQNYTEISFHSSENDYHQENTQKQMLAKMWRQRKSYTLLVGMQFSTFTMKISMEFSPKAKNTTSI
jgi:hypothetical protein